MLTYMDIENLPKDHPKVKQFLTELAENDPIFAAVVNDGINPELVDDPICSIFNLTDEESFDYFNRYIAGDR